MPDESWLLGWDAPLSWQTPILALSDMLQHAVTRALLQQVLAARRGGREALSEMAAQNARLVVGYCAKKAELRRLQEALASERARWEVRYRAETE